MALVPALTLVAAPNSSGTFYFVLLDTSASVHDSKPYDDAWGKVKARFHGGDRMAIALVKGDIPGQRGATFRKLEDQDLKSQTWFDNPLKFKGDEKKASTALGAAYEAAKKEPKAQHTELIRSLREVGKFFATDAHPNKFLLILSDMMEDSQEYDFEHSSMSSQYIDKVFKETTTDDRRASLNGVQVYVVGAGGRTEAQADGLEKFWVKYLKACGATFSHENYGSSVINLK
jgi:hypothetical protein